MTRLVVLSLVTLAALFPLTALAATPKDGRELVRAMHDKYAGKWYSTLTFVQKTTNVQEDGTSKVETWYEALACPGKLRIDFDPLSDNKGILFADDAIARVDAGKVLETKPFVHPLLVLGFDVYCTPVDATVARLEKLGFNLSTIREDTWEGKPVWVVGAKAGDAHSAQFWIEKDSLLFVRMLRPAGKDGSQTSEVVFAKYVKAGGGWVAAEVRFGLDGKQTGREDYSEIKADVALPEGLYDAAKWSSVHWR